jgi:hypothetical protein
MRCKLIDRGDCKFTLEPGSRFYQVFQLGFGAGKEADVGENQCWIGKSVLKIQQNDTYNCGPIACMKVLELYGCTEFKIMDHTISGTVHWYHYRW